MAKAFWQNPQFKSWLNQKRKERTAPQPTAPSPSEVQPTPMVGQRYPNLAARLDRSAAIRALQDEGYAGGGAGTSPLEALLAGRRGTTPGYPGVGLHTLPAVRPTAPELPTVVVSGRAGIGGHALPEAVPTALPTRAEPTRLPEPSAATPGYPGVGLHTLPETPVVELTRADLPTATYRELLNQRNRTGTSLNDLTAQYQESQTPELLAQIQDQTEFLHQIDAAMDEPRSTGTEFGTEAQEQSARWNLERLWYGRPVREEDILVLPPTITEEDRPVMQDVVPPMEQGIGQMVAAGANEIYSWMREGAAHIRHTIGPGFELPARVLNTVVASANVTWNFIKCAFDPDTWAFAQIYDTAFPGSRTASPAIREAAIALLSRHGDDVGPFTVADVYNLARQNLVAARLEGPVDHLSDALDRLNETWEATVTDAESPEFDPVRQYTMDVWTSALPGAMTGQMSVPTGEQAARMQEDIEASQAVSSEIHTGIDTEIAAVAGLQEQVQAGALTEEQAITQFGPHHQALVDHIMRLMNGETGEHTWTYQYSWTWRVDGPERQQRAAEAIAAAAEQLGHLPEPWLMIEITRRYADPGTELAGDIVFDPVWLCPPTLLDTIIVKPLTWTLKLPVRAATALWPHEMEVVGQIFRAAGTRAVSNLIADDLRDALRPVAVYAGEDQDLFLNLVRRLYGGELTELEARTIGLRPAQREILSGSGPIFQLLEGMDENAWARLMAQSVGGRAETAAAATAEEAAVWRAVDSIENIGNAMKRAYIEIHSYNLDGRGILDDTLTYWLLKHDPVVQEAAETFLSTEQAASERDALRMAIEEAATRGNRAFTPFRGGTAVGIDIIDGYLRFSRWTKRVWTELVLSARPGWVSINMIDTNFRLLVEGINPASNLEDLLRRYAGQLPESIEHGWSEITLAGRPLVQHLREGRSLGWCLRQAFQEGLAENITVGGIEMIGGGRASWWRGYLNAMNAAQSYFEIGARARAYFHLLDANLRVLRPIAEDAVRTAMREAGVESPVVEEYLMRAVRGSGGSPDAAARLILEGANGRVTRGTTSLLFNSETQAALCELLGEQHAVEFMQRLGDEVYNLLRQGSLTPESLKEIIDNTMDAARSIYRDSHRAVEDLAGTSGAFRVSASEANASAALGTDELERAAETGEIRSPRAVADADPAVTARRAEEEAAARRAAQADAEMAERVEREAAEITPLEGLSDDAARNRQDELADLYAKESAAETLEQGSVGQIDEYGNVIPPAPVTSHEPIRRAGAELADAHAIYADSTRRAMAQVDELVRQGAAPEVIRSHQQAIAYLQRQADELQRAYSGRIREFLLNQYPGPLAARGATRRDMWVLRNDAQRRLFAASRDVYRELHGLLLERNIDEILRRAAEGEIVTGANLLERAGFEFEWLGDDLVGFRISHGAPLIESPQMLAELQRSLGGVGRGELYGISAIAPAARAAAPAASFDDLLDEMGERLVAIQKEQGLAGGTYEAGRWREVVEGSRRPGAIGAPSQQDTAGRQLVQEYADRFGLTREEMDRALIEGRVPAAPTVAAPLPPTPTETAEMARATVETGGPVVADESLDQAWQTLCATRLNKTGGKGFSLRFGYSRTRVPGTSRLVLDSYDDFMGYAERKLSEAMSSGNERAIEYWQWLVGDVRSQWRSTQAFFGVSPQVARDVPQFHMLPQGTRMRLGSSMVDETTLEGLVAALDGWATGFDFENPLLRLTSAERTILRDRGTQIVNIMSQMEETVIRGGNFMGTEVTGALPRTNELLIDYHSGTPFDQWMKNFIPFWTFPSRTLPMWMHEVMLHPEIAASYYKYIRFSMDILRQRGMTTSSGEPLPSYIGYLPIPGTNLWVNPSRPISLRFIFPPMVSYGVGDEEENPVQGVVRFLYNAVTMFGLSPAPWISMPLFYTGLMDDRFYPESSLIPQTSLVPPFSQRYITGLLRQTIWPNAPDLLQPEVGFQDYLIEHAILTLTLDRMEGLPDDQRLALALLARDAISRWDREVSPEADALWSEARDRVEMSNYWRNMGGYFTGIYGRQYTDADGELLRIRDDINTMRRSMNDITLIDAFDYYKDAEQRWQFYLDRRYRTGEGILSWLRSSISWTRVPSEVPDWQEWNASGGSDSEWYRMATHENDRMRQTFGEERRRLVALRLDEEERTQARFAAVDSVRQWFNKAMGQFPVGYRGPETDQLWTEYFSRMTTIETNSAYDSANREWVVGYMPTELAFDDIRNYFWYTIEKTRPTYDPSHESYQDFMARDQQWIDGLASVPVQDVINALCDVMESARFITSENMPHQLYQRLSKEVSSDGLRQWELDRDTPIAALERVWREHYWNAYWSAVGDLQGDERRLAERRFKEQFPNPPTSDQLYQWIGETYGADRFSRKQLETAYNGRGVATVGERLFARETKVSSLEERCYDLIGQIPPGTAQQDIIDMLIANGGARMEDAWNAFMSGGADAFRHVEDFNRFADVLAQTIAASEWAHEPTDEELQERIQSRRENDQIRAEIASQLGSDIWDMRAAYYAMSYDAQEIWREARPEDWARIQQVPDLLNAAAQEHPIWAKYYRPPAAQEAAAEAGAGGAAIGGGTSRAATQARRAASYAMTYVPMGMRSTLEATELLKKPNLLGSARPAGTGKYTFTVPADFRSVAGDVAADAVEALINNGTPLSAATLKYLKGLRSRHPQDGPFIEQVEREQARIVIEHGRKIGRRA